MFNNLILQANRSHARVGHFLTNIGIQQLGEREGGVDPAVGVHHTLGYNLEIQILETGAGVESGRAGELES